MGMRLFEIETRKINTGKRPSIDDEIMKIRSECPTIINLYKKHGGSHFFVRGIKKEQDTIGRIVKKNIRTDRRSTYSADDTALIQQAYEELGIEAHRQNSIFVTTDYSIAKNWGGVFYIFPTDPFVFSYFEDITTPSIYPLFALSDAIYNARREQWKALPTTKRNDRAVLDNQKIVDAIKKVMVRDKITTTNLDRPLLTQREVLIHGASYYAVGDRDVAMRIINED